MNAKKGISTRSIVLAILAGAVLVAVGLAVGLSLGLRRNSGHSNKGSNDKFTDLNNNERQDGSYKSATGTYRYAAVAADSKVASQIGNDILARERGNAVDAAVATALATSVCNIHSAGIGGGGFIVLYDRPSNTWHAIDTREKAPGKATEDMFEDDPMKAYWGGLAIGVPGELLGLYEMHKRFGSLPWGKLVMPTIKLCKDGVPLTSSLHKALSSSTMTDEYKQEIAAYYDADGSPMPVGSLIKLPKLAATFEIIAEDPLSFYNGKLAEDIFADLQDAGSIITAEDLSGYSTKWTQPSQLDLPGDLKVFSMPAPGGGPVLNYILNILSGYNMSPESVASPESTVLTYHRIIEAFKFAYAKKSELSDEDFVDLQEQQTNMSSPAYGESTRDQIDDSTTHEPGYYHPKFSIPDDEGTTSFSVLDVKGSAVCITTSINGYFGSRERGKRTGILFNNDMADFSIPHTEYAGFPSNPANFIEPGKRALSSMTPTIVWDDARQAVRMVTGASGAAKITTAVAMSIMDVLWFNRSLSASMDGPRFHHQFLPNVVQTEENFPQDIVEGLKAKGHKVEKMQGFSVLQTIDVQEDKIVAASDFRKGGHPSGN